MAKLPPHFNYAQAFGFKSLPAAIVLSVVYAPLLVFFLRRSFTHPTFVHTVLALFCCIRLAAFIIRALLCEIDSAGESLGLVIADMILFGVGFAGLLYSAYTLVLDRDLLYPQPASRPLIARLFRNRIIFRIVIIATVIIGVESSLRTSNASHGTDNGTLVLRKITTIIFFILIVLLALQSIRLLRIEQRNPLVHTDKVTTTSSSIGQVHGGLIVCVISMLLLVRGVFYMATTLGDVSKQNNEALWYPLVALMEVLAVVLFAVPGLVPKRSELNR